jgi:hypothetical protein
MAYSPSYHRDYIFVKHSDGNSNSNTLTNVAKLNCLTDKKMMKEKVDIVNLTNNKHITGTFYSCQTSGFSLILPSVFETRKDYKITIQEVNILNENVDNNNTEPIVIPVKNKVLTGHSSSFANIDNEYVFTQDNPSSSTQVTQNDLNEFFSLKLDYGMIVFVSIAAILMAYFMIKHWLFATRKSFELPSKPSINSNVEVNMK